MSLSGVARSQASHSEQQFCPIHCARVLQQHKNLQTIVQAQLLHLIMHLLQACIACSHLVSVAFASQTVSETR